MSKPPIETVIPVVEIKEFEFCSDIPSEIFSLVEEDFDSTSALNNQNQILLLTEQHNLELKLAAFIQWSLKQSRTNRFTLEQNLQLLNCAWEAQKLLWSIRYS